MLYCKDYFMLLNIVCHIANDTIHYVFRLYKMYIVYYKYLGNNHLIFIKNFFSINIDNFLIAILLLFISAP